MPKAVAVLRGDAGVSGTVTFTQNSEDQHGTRVLRLEFFLIFLVNIDAHLTGLKPGNHGFHIQ